MNSIFLFSTLANSIVLAALVFVNLAVETSAAEYVEIGESLGFRLLSADGSVVAGTGGDFETWTWSRSNGFTQVMPTRADVYVNLNSISRDGSVLVGAEREASFGGFNQAFRWTEETGSVLLDPTVEFGRSQASGLTNSGIVVGSFGDPAGGGRELFQWKNGEGMEAIDIPEVPLIFNSPVVSDDGAVIAGAISNFVQPNGNVTAFVWNRTTGRVEKLGVLPGYRVSRSSDISSDGTIVVGTSADPRSEAYRWTEGTGMQGLGMLPGDTESASSSVSDDGKVIFGISRRREGGDSITTDVVWDEQLQIHEPSQAGQ